MRPRRVTTLIAGAAALVALALAACQPSAGPQPSQTPGGRIAWPKDGDLWVYDVASQRQTKITSLPRGAAVTSVSWSPDGTKLVYSQIMRRPGENATGADLWIANADGSEPRIFAERDSPSTMLDAPVWSRGGRIYYTVRSIDSNREVLSVVRKADGGAVETLVQGGYNASVYPDESAILYHRNTRAGVALWQQPLGGNGQPCELLPDSAFMLIGIARVSPDGKQILLPASGDTGVARGGCNGSGARPGGLLALAEWLGVAPRTAWAHGLPWDVWVMSVETGELKRLVELKEDEPNATWSPDGTQVAVFGVAALYVADVRGGPPRKLVDQGGYGGLDWTK